MGLKKNVVYSGLLTTSLYIFSLLHIHMFREYWELIILEFVTLPKVSSSIFHYSQCLV